MSISNVTSSQAQAQALARQIATAVDTDRDGQVSLAEFGAFLLNALGASSTRTAAVSKNGTTAAVADAGRAPLGFTPQFFGFDASRAQSAAGSLKYDAYNVLQSYDPHDPAAMRQAFTVLDAMHPGKYELDPQDNLMLTGTADGYIGARPLNRDSDWNNRNQDWGWTWFGYNTAHPGPNGEIT
jgi:hypothetical protein